MKQAIILFSLFTFLLSCSGGAEVFIRVDNNSTHKFENIIVGNGKDYGNLEPGEASDYQEFETAYTYGFVELTINQDTFTIQPIDFVGETPLTSGNYTYELSTNETNDRYSKLMLTFKED